MRNWTIKEAVEVVNAGTDTEAIKEIAKHFPLSFMAIVKNDLAGLTSAMNDKFTLRKVEVGFGAVESDGEEDTDEVAAETEEAAVETEEASEDELRAKSTKDLMRMCDAKGIKVPHYGKNKQFYLDALLGATDAEPEEEVEEEEESENPYEGKTAMELYKECKSRGIKAAAKKTAKFYTDLLVKADAEADDVEEEADDDWEEEEVPAKKAPAKKAATKGPKAKAAKKAPAKKAEPEEAEEAEDDGDDWDI